MGMKKILAWPVLVAAVLFFSACALTKPEAEHNQAQVNNAYLKGKERWDLTEARQPHANQNVQATDPALPVSVIIYRVAKEDARLSDPINLYIDKHYQASLIGNTYTEQWLCPGDRLFSVAFNDVTNRHTSREQGVLLPVQAVPVQYFVISQNEQGQAVIQPASQEQAAQYKNSLKRLQKHTIPRVVTKACAVSS